MEEAAVAQIDAYVVVFAIQSEKHKVAGLQRLAGDGAADAGLRLGGAGQRQPEGVSEDTHDQPRAVDAPVVEAAPTVGRALPALQLGQQTRLHVGVAGRRRRRRGGRATADERQPAQK